MRMRSDPPSRGFGPDRCGDELVPSASGRAHPGPIGWVFRTDPAPAHLQALHPRRRGIAPCLGPRLSGPRSPEGDLAVGTGRLLHHVGQSLRFRFPTGASRGPGGDGPDHLGHLSSRWRCPASRTLRSTISSPGIAIVGVGPSDLLARRDLPSGSPHLQASIERPQGPCSEALIPANGPLSASIASSRRSNAMPTLRASWSTEDSCPGWKRPALTACFISRPAWPRFEGLSNRWVVLLLLCSDGSRTCTP